MIKENPYQASLPINDSKDYFGRKREFRFMYQMLMSNESVNIIGPRRIGKTSFLNVLTSNDIQHKFFSESIFNEKDIFLFLDMQSQKSTTPTDFLSRLAEQIHVNGIDVNRKMQSYYDFEKVLDQLTREGNRIFILLDEFDSVAQNDHFDIEFYDMLRHYQQRYRVSYIVASTKGIKEVSKSTVTSSEFFTIFRVLRLGLLQEKDANDLICKDDLVSQHVNFVKLITGYHPFFVTQLCFYLFHFHLYEADTPIEKIREMSIYHFLDEAFDHFSYYWEHLSTEERTVLKKISTDKKVNQDDAPEVTALKLKALIIEQKERYTLFSYSFSGFVEEIKFSKRKEELSQFMTKNTKTLVSIAKYCVEKAIELKK